MAHYLAETLAEAERSQGREAATARRIAAGLVLELWDRRQLWPVPRRPFESLAPLHEALDRLAPEQPDWAFYRYFDDAHRPAVADDLLDAAVAIERSAGDVVRACIVVAAERAADTEAPWLTVARQLAAADEADTLRALRRRLAAVAPDAGDFSEDPEGQDAANELVAAVARLSQSLDALRQQLTGPGTAALDDD